MKDTIKMIQPKPYKKVELNFVISGWVPKTWLESEYGISNRIFLDFIDINGRTFIGRSADIVEDKGWFSKFRKKLKFYAEVQFDRANAHFIIESQGYIAFRLSGNKPEQQLFVPIIVKSSNPKFIPDPDTVIKHKKIEETVLRHEREFKEYMDEAGKIWERRLKKSGIDEYMGIGYKRISDQGFNWGIFNILEEQEGDPKNSLFAEEDLELQKLEEKYKEAIEIDGPLLGADILSNCGFHFIIYSNDHGKHLHVIHKGRGVDIKISFPEIKIESYVRGKLSSKQEKKIIKFLKEPNNFEKLKTEFSRRDE